MQYIDIYIFIENCCCENRIYLLRAERPEKYIAIYSSTALFTAMFLQQETFCYLFKLVVLRKGRASTDPIECRISNSRWEFNMMDTGIIISNYTSFLCEVGTKYIIILIYLLIFTLYLLIICCMIGRVHTSLEFA